jgi:hypothetical protein
MLRYNINSGVKKIKTKTAIVASVVTLGIGGATFGLAALPFAAHAATGIPNNFPTSNCDSGHGAPGGLGKDYIQAEKDGQNKLPNGNVAPSGGSEFGMEQGADTTGLNNSGLAQTCRNL